MKKTFCKIVSVLLSMAILFSLTVSTSAKDGNISAVILYTNDVHCAVDNYSILSAYRKELINDGYEVITIDGGDAIQGEVIGTLTNGSAIVEIMNSVGYDYAVPGNHEFDYSTDTLLGLTQEAAYSYMSCNFVDLLSSSTVFEPYYIEEINGEQVAFLGISTPESYTKSSPAYFQDENGNFIYSFSEDKFYDTIQKNIDSAISEGADRVIAIGHLGIDGTTDGWKSTDVIKNTSGIDVFLDAHAHMQIESEVYNDNAGKEVLLQSTSSKFNYFGKITLNSDGTETAELIDPDNLDVTDFSESAQAAYSKTKNIIDNYNEQLSYLYEKLGTSEVKLSSYAEDGNWLVRRSETNMGDFVTDAYRSCTGADIAIANGGGIRADINPGDVTRKNLIDVNPWSNNMCVIEVTGQQIADALEHGARLYPETSGGFLQVSGLTYEVNAYIESPVILDEMQNFVGVDIEKPRRVANIKIGSEEIDFTKTYTLAGNAYNLTQGGDGFTMFKDAKIIKSEELPTDSEMLIKYFTENLEGKITKKLYANELGNGRIILNTEEPTREPQPTCWCLCHIECPVISFVWSVINFFLKLFNICKCCPCGAVHF